MKAEICDNRRQIAHVRLESLAGAENPYSLMQVFGRGHQVTRNGATVYVTKCQAVEVVPRQHTECTNEIPVTFNDTEVFVDPNSLVIKPQRPRSEYEDGASGCLEPCGTLPSK